MSRGEEQSVCCAHVAHVAHVIHVAHVASYELVVLVSLICRMSHFCCFINDFWIFDGRWPPLEAYHSGALVDWLWSTAVARLVNTTGASWPPSSPTPLPSIAYGASGVSTFGVCHTIVLLLILLDLSWPMAATGGLPLWCPSGLALVQRRRPVGQRH